MYSYLPSEHSKSCPRAPAPEVILNQIIAWVAWENQWVCFWTSKDVLLPSSKQKREQVRKGWVHSTNLLRSRRTPSIRLERFDLYRLPGKVQNGHRVYYADLLSRFDADLKKTDPTWCRKVTFYRDNASAHISAVANLSRTRRSSPPRRLTLQTMQKVDYSEK